MPLVGAGVAMAIALLILAGLNFYHVVISDYPSRQKLLRVLLALLVIIPLTAGLGFILRLAGGL
jgi:VIT1/CCC1 family predicted Fe2+/Mn2+ transporter